MADERKPRHFVDPLTAEFPKVPITPELEQKLVEEKARNRERLFRFLEEARHILSDDAYPDMVGPLGDLADPDQQLFMRLRDAY